MKKLGGNITATVQTQTMTVNDIGEKEATWSDIATVKGYLDYQSGEAEYTNFNAKLQESTHVFVCDEFPDVSINSSRMIIKGWIYEILLIDNPMELNYHYEIYLRFVGGQ